MDFNAIPSYDTEIRKHSCRLALAKVKGHAGLKVENPE